MTSSSKRVENLNDINDSYLVSTLKNTSKQGYEFKIDTKWKYSNVINLKRNALKGMCWSYDDKYIQLIQGSLFIAIFDLRKESTSYFKKNYLFLNETHSQSSLAFIPKGCLFGILSQIDNSIYIVGRNSEEEYLMIDPFDKELGIEWSKEDYPIIKEDNYVPFKSIFFKQESSLHPRIRYEPKNILITGGAGFIGSHVSIHLTTKYPNYNIIVFDILDYCANIKNLDSLKSCSNFKFIHGDITDYSQVNKIFEDYQIDCVLHFAALSHVDYSYENSLLFTETNIKGTHILIENARKYNCKRFIHVSTDEVYGTTGEQANENESLEPTNPYACTKLAAECILMSYQKLYSKQISIIITRINNVYGPHQFIEKVIPKFILRLHKNKKCCVYGDGSSERDFIYISDVVTAYDLILHYGDSKLVYNIGSSKGIKIIDLARMIINKIKGPNSDDEFIEFVQDRLCDDKRYKIDSSNLTRLGWKQEIDFEQGLDECIKWYTQYQDYWPNSDYALEAHSFLKK